MDDGEVTSSPAEPAPDGASTASSPRRSRPMLMVLAGVAAFALAVDVIVKLVAVAVIEPGNPVHIIGDTVELRLVRNSGAAFSMGSGGYTWILTIIALCVVIGIIKFASRLRSVWWAIGLGLVLGGAMGNLVDRLFRSPGPLRGHVVDYISVGWWPVFNMADSAVVGGAIVLVVLTLFGFEIDGTRAGADDSDGEVDKSATRTAKQPDA